MPSPPKDCSDWLIGLLENEITNFDDITDSLLEGQRKAFSLCCALLREDSVSLKDRSKSVRSVRLRAREFLMDIFRLLGPELFLLCTLTVSITKLGDNANKIRWSKLRSWWKHKQPPQSLVIIAKDICKDSKIDTLIPSSPKRDGLLFNTSAQHVTPEISSDHSGFATAREQLVLEYASLRGIAQICADSSMCDTVRRVAVDGGWKAAITMVFPGWIGPVQCLMSLDICEQDIAQLAMALFNTEVKWIGNVLHVVLDNGMTLTTESSEVILKGVEDETIKKAFGSEIHAAISECPIRKRETKPATECVSMILTMSGAIINLSLGIRGGLQIKNKLYN